MSRPSGVKSVYQNQRKKAIFNFTEKVSVDNFNNLVGLLFTCFCNHSVWLIADDFWRNGVLRMDDNVGDLRLGSYLTAYFNSLTHEIIHALEFIENSGGLSPHDVDVCFDSGDFDNTVQDCATGENTMAYSDEYADLDSGDPDDASEIVNIMETRVENKGMDLLTSLSLDLVALYKQEKVLPKNILKSVL